MFLRNKMLAVSAFSLMCVCGASAQDAMIPNALRAESQIFRFEIGGNSFLGVQTENVTRENFSKYNLREPRGVAVTKVVETSPAAQAGVQIGDVIVRFDGEEVKSVSKLLRLIGEVAPDQKAQITILRGGSEQQITATVGKRPEPPATVFENNFPQTGDRRFNLPPLNFPDVETFRREFPQNVPNEDFMIFRGGANRQIGVSLSPLSRQLGDYFGVADGKGLLVSDVRENSPAAKAGLRAGDVIVEADGKAVSRTADLLAALGGKTEGDLTLTIIRNRQRQTVRVTPEKPAAPLFPAQGVQTK